VLSDGGKPGYIFAREGRGRKKLKEDLVPIGRRGEGEFSHRCKGEGK